MCTPEGTATAQVKGKVKIVLRNWTSHELAALLAPHGFTARAARLLHQAAVRTGDYPPPGDDLSARTLDRLRACTTLPRLELAGQTESRTDGFVKFLFRGDGPDPFEAVRIPLLHRASDPKYVVCVSSQVGCGLGCAFCATGRMGFRRDLSTWEIVDQVAQIRAVSPHPVRGVVFMGMGEPMLNYDAVLRAADILSEPCGLAIPKEAITISTAGIVAGIRRFTAERRACRLVVSLNTADPVRRRELMPVEAGNPTPELMAALREYHAATGERVILAWTMIAGVNTDEAAACALADLTRGLPVKLDLIDANDATGRFPPPSPAELSAFRDALRRHLGMPVARRYSGGRDIQAACGMLCG